LRTQSFQPLLSGLLLNCLHVGLEPIQARLPNRTLLGQPSFSIGHGGRLQPAGANAPAFLGFYEADGLQHPDMLHQTGQRHVEWLGEFSDRSLALAQTLKHRSSGWVRKSAEHKVKIQ